MKVNLATRIYPTKNLEFFFILKHWSYSKCKDVLQMLNVYQIPVKEDQVVDRWDADEIPVS